MEGAREITIDELIDRYAALLLDAYGVLVDSSGTFPGAIELIAKLNRTGKPYYLMTNDASALPSTRAERCLRLGLPIEASRIITSGVLLKGHFEAHGLQGARCVVLGTEDSARYVEGAGGRVVSYAEAFDAVVIGNQSGFPFVETVDAVMSALFRKLDRGENVRLVMPNPDLIFPTSEGGFGMASASVALILEAALELRYPNRADLRFVRLGKPYAAIFEEALRRSGTRDMLMIGDQLETDIRGANAFGIDSALVGTGITPATTTALPEELRPTYYLRSLVS